MICEYDALIKILSDIEKAGELFKNIDDQPNIISNDMHTLQPKMII